jgi:hypothetical protein
MFNSVIIDVAIGLTLSFLAVSFAASAITEAISSAMKWREKTLLEGIKALMNDQGFKGIALQLYNHALVNPLASGKARTIKELTNMPAYIDSRQFALAFYSALSENSPQGAPATELIAKISDPQLKTAMENLWAISSQNVETFKHNIAVWFDNSMDRLSGWYKRRTQWVSFLVALAIAVIFNVNALYESAQIWSRPGVIADLTTEHFSEDRDRASDAAKIFNALEPEFLVGWVKGPMPHDFQSWFIAGASWVLVAAASLFGASFWFDILQRITHLKGTGLVPERSESKLGLGRPPSSAQPTSDIDR